MKKKNIFSPDQKTLREKNQNARKNPWNFMEKNAPADMANLIFFSSMRSFHIRSFPKKLCGN